MRYGPNFIQSLEPKEITRLPAVATYEGGAEDLRHLRGRAISTQEVEALVYVGERENVWVTMPDGRRHRPWIGCWITELDAAGEVVTKGYGRDADPIPERAPDAMSSGELSGMGLTDAKLADMARTLLGQAYTPDRSGRSDLRRSVYNRVMAAQTHR